MHITLVRTLQARGLELNKSRVAPKLRNLFGTALILLFSGVLYVHSDPAAGIELLSPKNDSHLAGGKPLFFWGTNPTVQSYQVFVDGARIGEVPAAQVPVMNYGAEVSLPAGTHQWYVKAVPSTSDALVSSTGDFTIDPPGNWPAWAIGPFDRYGNNPILRPQGTGWEGKNVYNPGVLFDGGKFRMLYRAQGKVNGISKIGYAESVDGVTFNRDPEPLIDATEPFEKKYGCEDPRFVKYQGVYYVFYTGDKNGNIAECEATSTDGRDWKKLGPIEPGTKNGALVLNPQGEPVKINGKFAMFIGDSKFGVCYSDDLTTWGPITWINMHLPPGWTTPYEPCVAITDYSSKPDDVVLLMAGTLNGKGKWFYAISEALFSKSDLTKKVDQLDDCIMKPREAYENGTFIHCLWTNCLIQHNQQWMLFYGAGDRNVGLATAAAK